MLGVVIVKGKSSCDKGLGVEEISAALSIHVCD